MRPVKKRKARPSVARSKTSQYVLRPGAHSPIAQLRLIDATRWEKFVEDCCVTQMGPGLRYVKVKRLGGSGDLGRDVEALMSVPRKKHKWDLYQGKYYDNALSRALFYSELAKFFLHIFNGDYPEPSSYYLCAPRDCSTELHDLLMNPKKFKDDFLTEWNAGGAGLKSFQKKLTAPVKAVVDAFNFRRIKEFQARELLVWHKQNPKAHHTLFGIVPERKSDPAVPPKPDKSEQKYVKALIAAYSEFKGLPINLEQLASAGFDEHFEACRSQFYSAEGLKRFSRDIFQDEFEHLLDDVYTGVRPVWASPRHKTGIDRLDAVTTHASTLKVNDNPLSASLRAPDLPGTCHHLANDGRLKWVR